MESYITDDIFTRQVNLKTLKAWEPFSDCVSILFTFQKLDVADGDDELRDWRIFWVSGITLLRAVGHVLAKVDKHKSAQHKEVIDRNWETFRSEESENVVLWKFIEKERNNLIKTYSWGARLAKDDYGYSVEYENRENAFDLFREAVYWWRYQLEKIEAELYQLPSSGQ
tara:strand:- start:105 stop:611 length:507 start_codon:yes stop_codon:yes gene_type:complete